MMRRAKVFAYITAALLSQALMAQPAPSAPAPQGTQPAQPQQVTPVQVPAPAQLPPPVHLPATQNIIYLTRKQAEGMAIRNNPNVTVAKLAALASHEVWRAARADLLPTAVSNITAVGTDNGNRISAGALNNPVLYDRAAYGAIVSQLITDFGHTRNLVAGANYRAKAQDQNAIATANQIKLAVDRAFYTALGAQSVLTVAKQTVAARQVLSDQVTTLAQHKLKSSLDVSFANTMLDQAQLLLLDSENQYNAALAALAEVLGFQGPQSFELVDAATEISPPPSDVTGLISAAYDQRPELRAQDLELQAARKFQAAAHEQLFPRIEALGAVGQAPVREDQISSWYGAAGINVQIPIFTGFRIQAQTKEAQLRAEAENERITVLKNAISRDVRTSWLTEHTNFRRVSVTAALLDETKMALDLAQTRYRLGLGTIVEVSQAQLAETEAEIANARARYDYLLSQAVIRFETGTI